MTISVKVFSIKFVLAIFIQGHLVTISGKVFSIKFVLAIFIQGHLVTISVEVFSILTTGLEVIKLEFILKLKITKRKRPIISLYFEFETVLKFYNLEAWLLGRKCLKFLT